MANEKKQNEVIVSEQDFEKSQNVEVEVADIEFDNKFYVSRKPIANLFSKEGRQLYTYVVEGEIKNRPAKVFIEPYDVRGYDAFEYIFGESDIAELVIKETKKRDFSTNRITLSQELFIKDDLGLVVKVKCSAQSDRDILQMLITLMRRKQVE